MPSILDRSWQRHAAAAVLACLGCVLAGAQAPQAPTAGTAPPQRAGREVKIDGPSGVLAGTLLLPAPGEGGRLPAAVVFVTGSGPQDRDETIFGHRIFEPIAAALAAEGIASLRCDDRGFGASTGDLAAATTLDFVADARAQVAWLRGQGEVDPQRIGVIGHSEGGLVATLMASADPPSCAFAVLLAAPAVSGREILAQQNEDLMRTVGGDAASIAFAREMHGQMLDAVAGGAPDAQLREAVRACVEAQMACNRTLKPTDAMVNTATDAALPSLRSPWMRTFLGLDPAPAIRTLRVPVLALFGERDVQVSIDQNLAPFRLAAADAPTKPVIEVVAGVNHLFQRCKACTIFEYATLKEGVDPDVVRRIATWVAQTARVLPQGRSGAPASSH